MALPARGPADHLHGRYIHIDFLAVRRDEKVKINVEIHETGEAAGIKTGGVIEHHLRDVEIESLPGRRAGGDPRRRAALELGDMLRVGDITPPAGVSFLTDPDTPVISSSHRPRSALRPTWVSRARSAAAEPEEAARREAEATPPQKRRPRRGGEG